MRRAWFASYGVSAQAPRRYVRRLAAAMVLSLALTVGAPDGSIPDQGGFSLSWLWSWSPRGAAMSTTALVGLPVRASGPAPGGDHYVSAGATRADGGNGRRPGTGIGALPADVAPTRRVQPSTTRPVPGDHSFEPATSRLVPSSQVADSEVYANADGSFTRRVYEAPVSFKAADGSWQRVDHGLTRGADGRVRQRASSVDVTFAGSSDDADLVRLRLAGGHAVSYSMLGAAKVVAVVAGETVTYPSVLSNVDLRLSATPSGVKEAMVLHSADVATSWVFPLRLTGLAARLEKDGSVSLRDGAGARLAVMPAGFMEDSRFDLQAGAFTRSRGVFYQLTTVDGGPALRVSVDRAWLADPARVFPVTVDPTLDFGTTEDTYVVNTETANHNGADELLVGTWNGGGERAYSFLRFNWFGSTFQGAKISATSLKIFDSWAFTCTAKPFWVNPVTQDWTAATATSYPGPSFGAAIGTVTANPGPACTNTSGDRSVGTWMTVPLSTGTLQSWALGGGNFGLAVTASQTDSTQWKRFTSSNGPAGLAPYLQVTYAPNVAPQVDAQYPPSGHPTTTLTPELLVTAHDPDGWPKALTHKFLVYDKNAVNIADSGWVSARSWVVPASVNLRWGEVYTWTVVAYDSAAVSTSATVNVMAVVVPQPLVTSGLAQNDGRGFAPDVGNYTTSAVDAQVSTVGPALAVRRSYNSQDPRLASAFGLGWSSLFDTKVTEQNDTTGALATVVVTYPGGQEVAFGRNTDGTFAPPSGRFASFTTVSGGYRLVDKDGTAYTFTAATGVSGQFGLTSVADAQGRTQAFTFTAGRMSTVTSASGRALHLTWSTPPGATAAHVATVATDPVTVGVPASALTWTYTHAGDLLTKVCPPTSSTACVTYTYATSSRYASAVLNAAPRSYWRLGEASGPAAVSAVPDRQGTDNGTYTDVTLGQAGPLPGSTAKAAGFDGASSRVALPANLVTNASRQSLSMWFKTSVANGVLFGQSADPPSVSGTSGGYQPVLYVGSDGKLVGQFPTAPATGPLGSLVGWGSGRCLDVVGPSNADTTPVHLWDCDGGVGQQWTLTPAGELTVTIGGLTKCLDAAGYGTGDGTELYLFTCHGGPNQKWVLSANGNVVGVQSGRCVDVQGFGTANGSNIYLFQCFSPTRTNQTWFGATHSPIQSSSSVADGSWHHVVLSAASSTQTLYLDGVSVGSVSGVVQDVGQKYASVGAGFLGGGWPNQPAVTTIRNTGTRAHLNGSIAEVALFDRPLTATNVASLHATGTVSTRPLSSAVRPSGNVSATVAYDGATGVVSEVTDNNGGLWRVNAATVSGSSQVYAGAVLAGGPADYWRLAETGTIDAVNEVNGNMATYNAVTLGVAGGPFEDATVAGFNATSSYLELPAEDIPSTGPNSVSMWFKMPAGHTGGGTLFGYQTNPVTSVSSAVGNWTPALYVGTDGKLRGKFCWCAGSAPITSTAAVNNGQWHHAVLSASTGVQTLYLDGAAVGSVSLPVETTTAQYVYVGAGETTAWPARPTNPRGYFNGQIAEVAFHRSQLSAAQATAQFSARAKTSGVPVKTITVTDPGNQTETYVYELATGRKLADVDTLGNKTQYGFDVGGFLRTVTDPNGNVVTTEHDVRGNTVSQTTCQDQSASICSTVYFTYYPNSTATVLSPDPRNDVLLTTRDGRSASATDNTYLTTFAYAANGNRTSVTDPLGRVTTTGYTDGTTVAAADGGLAPAGLPMTVTTAAGATQSVVYFHGGDVATVTDPAGKVTSFSHDALGRVLSTTETTDTFPAGLTTSYGYDGLGRAVQQVAPAATNRVTGAVHTPVTTTGYDVDGLVTSRAVADTTGGDASRTVSATYNTLGQKVTETDPAGETTHLGYDAYGNLVEETDADGGTARTTYDAEGRLLTSKLVGYLGDPNNPGPVTDVVLASKAYDPAGRLASVTDAMGWVTAFTYTDNGLTATVTRTDPSTSASFVLRRDTYDAAGNPLSQKTNDDRTTTVQTLDAAGRTTSSTLDPAGLGRTTSYGYSLDDHVVSTTLSSPTETVSSSETTYDPLGRPVTQTIHNGLVGRWRLNETSGTTAADSAGDNPATVTGPVAWSTEHGGSASFTTSGGSLATAGPVVDTTRGFTIAAWLSMSNNTSARKALATTGSAESSFELRYDPAANRWKAVMRQADASNVSAQSTSTPALDTWTHLAGVYDAATATMRLYVNGTLEGTAAVPNPVTFGGPLLVGCGFSNGNKVNFWRGKISDVQAYSRVLTPFEIGRVHAGTAPGDDGGVVRTSWALDQGGLARSTTDPNGDTTDYDYDEAGRLTVSTGPAVPTESGGASPVLARPVSAVGYDTFGAPVESKDPNGNVTVTAYDAAGRVVSTTLPAYTPPGSSTPVTAVATRTYDGLGQPLTVTDPLGETTSYLHDQLGRVARVTDPNGGQTRLTHDLLGDRLSVTDPTGATSTATYDHVGRRVTSTQVVRQTSASHTTTYSYGPGGWLSSALSPAGVTTSMTYDAAGDTLTVRDGANNVTTLAYDAAGRTIRSTLPDASHTTVGYDMVGRAVATTSFDPSGTPLATRSKGYDAAGNVTATTDARGTTTTFGYDAAGRLAGEVQPTSGVDAITTSFGYDVAGNPTRFTDGRGNAFLTTYNSWNLPESRVEPSTAAYPSLADRTFTVAYDAAGRVASRAAPGGVNVTLTYDDVGNLTRQAGAGAEASTVDRVFGYDLAGRLTTASAPGGTDTFSWDDRGLLLAAGGPSGSSSFIHTADGAMASRTDAAGTTSYGYDGAGRLSSVANPTAGVAVSYAYNSLSQPTLLTYGSSGNRRSLAYDGLHRLAVDELKTPAAVSIGKIAYGWDANGNETSKTTTGFAGAASNTYAYDLADRLVSWGDAATTTAYAYDGSGNRTGVGARSFGFDARNQLTVSGGTAYQYTARGTLAATVTPAGTTTTQTDAFGQVRSQQVVGGGTQAHDYDGLGRALRSGFAYTGLGNTLAGDGSATYTRDPSGALLGAASGSAHTLAWTDLHTDVVAQFTAVGTALSGSAGYSPLGEVVATAGLLGGLGFQSGWSDTATGRVNMWSRWYNPDTGQFDTRDSLDVSPVPASVSGNRFGYADANPLTNTDPTGHCASWNPVCRVAAAASSAVSTAYHATTAAVASAYQATTSYASSAWNTAANWARDTYRSAQDYVETKAEQGRQYVATQVDQARQQVRDTYERARQVGAAVVATTTRVVTRVVSDVTDVYRATEKWVKDHKDLIIEVAAIGLGVLAGLACTAATAGAGAVACMVGAAALVNLAKDAAQGNLRDAGDVFGSLGTGAVQGLLGGAGGILGGKLAGYAAGRLGGLAASAGGRALGGGLSGAVSDVGVQLATTGRVDWAGVATSAGIGAVFGGTTRGPTRAPTPNARPTTTTPTAPAGTGAPGCHSFDPDTHVLMADGSTKAIKDVTLGDTVTTTNPEHGNGREGGGDGGGGGGGVQAQPVVALHDNRDTDLTDLTVTSPDGTQAVVRTTAHHPFWDHTTRTWTNATDLEPARSTLTTPHGHTATVTAVRDHTGDKPMRDLTIANTHTYYVIAGNQPVLVHNCGGDTIRARDVRFTQYSMKSEFKDGSGSIIDTANGLTDGSINPSSIPAIKIFERDGQIFSLDNRRLFAGQYADVELPLEWATKAEIANRRMTYVDNGLSIKIRGVGWWSNY